MNSSEIAGSARVKASRPDTSSGTEVPALHLFEGRLSNTPTTEQRQLLEDQWRRFWTLRNSHRPGPRPLLCDGALVHGVSGVGFKRSNGAELEFDEAWFTHTLESLFRIGVLSCEIGDGDKTMKAEGDGETHFCADFFRYEGAKIARSQDVFSVGNPVANYVGWYETPLATSNEALPNEKRWRNERMYLPGTLRAGRSTVSYSVGVVFHPTPDLAPLMERSGSCVPREDHPCAGFIRRYTEVPEHVVVLVGLPANHIDTLILGEGLSQEPALVARFKSSLARHGLSPNLVDAEGRPLR